MTPPSARKRPTATRSVERTTERGARQFLGADQLTQVPGQRSLPAGVTHVVDGWQPVCGGPRVRFVFPGCTPDDVDEVCGACAGTTTRRVPRPRRASTG